MVSSRKGRVSLTGGARLRVRRKPRAEDWRAIAVMDLINSGRQRVHAGTKFRGCPMTASS
jgi:hypothetical protein